MYTVDEIVVGAPVDVCFQVAADVEQWPEVLEHYRWVRFQQKEGFGTGRVEMAARRSFGPLPYPVWWVSDMSLEESRPAVLYHHVEGVTTGMDVVWSFDEVGPARTHVKIVHVWDVGPAWPLPRIVRKWIADRVIGPIFINHVASRTLRGISRKAESLSAAGRVTP